MPFSLAEHVVAQTEPLKKGVFLGILRESVISDMLSFRSTGRLHEAGIRYDEVIEPDFIPINGVIAEKTARGKNLSYGVYQMAVHLDMPVALQNDQGVLERPQARQSKLAVIGSAYKLNDQFVNGDQGADPNGFEGINKIIGNLASAQSVGATELDIRTAPSDDTIQSVIDRIDEGFHAIQGHKPDFGLINSQTGLRLRSIFRRADLLGVDKDWINDGMPFGNIRQKLQSAATKPMFVYQGVPFYDIGVKADQSTQIMLNTYTEGGSTSTGSRIFLVKKGEDDTEMLQYAAPNVKSIGLLEDKEVERSRFTWSLGLAVWGSKSLVKIQGLRVA